jgi:hypothetical protein
MATTTAVMTEPQSQPDVITPATNNTAPAEKPKAAVPPKQTIPSTSSAEHPFPLLALDRKSEWIQCPHCNAIAKTTCVLDATDSTQ